MTEPSIVSFEAQQEAARLALENRRVTALEKRNTITANEMRYSFSIAFANNPNFAGAEDIFEQAKELTRLNLEAWQHDPAPAPPAPAPNDPPGDPLPPIDPNPIPTPAPPPVDPLPPPGPIEGDPENPYELPWPPATVMAGSIFRCAIVLRNQPGAPEGMPVWEKDTFRVKIVSPNIWGTSEIPLHKDVPLGNSVGFIAYFRAPTTIGKHSFDWQLFGPNGGFDRISRFTIEVLPAASS